MRTTFTRSLAAIALAGSLSLSMGSASAHEDHDDGNARPRLTGSQSREIRHATKDFRDVDVALAAGYLPAGGCVELAGVGGMGYHYIKPALAGDGVIDPTQPELLVYEADRRGRLRLVAVEYFKADADQDLRTDGDRPQLFGQPFEGPMPGHEPGMPVHFDLHVWLYEANPSGQLSSWNPRVSCP